MRRSAILLAVLVLGLAGERTSEGAATTKKIRLAQSSNVTSCMMACNSQAATCQTTCLIPGTPPTASATTTSNATQSTSCQLNCSTQQISCQTICARTSPSP